MNTYKNYVDLNSYSQYGIVDIQSGVSDVVSTFEFVDLGLPSGTLWATCNVGANNPEEFGLYFTWGEIYGMKNSDDYSDDLDNFRYLVFDPESDDVQILKYNSNDGKTILDLSDDAAYLYDKTVRMPTSSECKELSDFTTASWEVLNGVNGTRITSNINGNSIFIPAAGVLAPGETQGFGEIGMVQSSELITNYGDYSMNYVLYYGEDVIGLSGSMRYIGATIRPIKA